MRVTGNEDQPANVPKGPTRRKMPWLNQAYRKQPVVAVSHLSRRGEQVDPVKKEEHNVKNFVTF